MDLKGSKTEANLAYAFAGESQARNKYRVNKSSGHSELRLYCREIGQSFN